MKRASDFPLYDVTPFGSIREMLSLAAEEAASKNAFRFSVGSTVEDITYRHFVDDVYALGAALHELGLTDRHVAQIGENSYRYITVYLTMIASCGVYMPIDKDLPEEDILHLLRHSDSSAVFYTEKYSDLMHRNADALPGIRNFILVEPYGSDAAAEDSDPRFLSYTRLLAHGYDLVSSGYTGYAELTPDPAAMRMLVYTSGTTGIAKGVMLSEHNLVSSVYYGLQVSGVYDSCLSVLPYHHTYEAVSGLLVGIHHHSTICINENLKTVMKNFALFQPEYIYLVPAFVEEFYRRIWATAKKSGKDKALHALIKTSNAMRKTGIDMRKTFFASIREAFGGKLIKIVCGGAPIRPELGEFFDAIGINLINGYGITECSPLVSANRDNFNDPATVGVVLPCCQVKFDDVTEDGDGEICVKGDIVMMGYYKDPERTAEVLEPDGWFHTGDYGRMNEAEQLIITGRKKNIIVLSNGKNIYPEELEGYIQGIPYVKEVIVYGAKNELGNETALNAEVFLNDEKLEELRITDPAETLKHDVAKACAKLPAYKRISKIIIRSHEFTTTTSKKIKRTSIGEEHAENETAN